MVVTHDLNTQLATPRFLDTSIQLSLEFGPPSNRNQTLFKTTDLTMPCRAKHLKIDALAGAVGGGVYSAVRQYETVKNNAAEEFDVSEVIWDTARGGAAGAVAGFLPDVLEPPISPNHRGFFHSVPVLAVLIFAATLLLGRSKTALLGLFFSFLIGYGSHLWADGNTPQGLPS